MEIAQSDYNFRSKFTDKESQYVYKEVDKVDLNTSFGGWNFIGD